jgi:UDP-GlcNAc:undecaprenyl-phosphate GlcNAc-1-phosphate transferase
MTIQLLAPFLLALGLNLLLIPLVRRVSFRLGRVAQPREDRWHRQPTPTLGGVGIFLSFVVSLLVCQFIFRDGQWARWGFLSGSLLMFAVGLYDEFRPMSPVAKLVGQILAATLVISLGYSSTFFSPRLQNNLLAQLPNILFTFVWLIGITNAINLLDNMDGLAGGISLITAAILGYFFWQSGNLSLMWVTLALVGSILGFLVFNFPPARIFMGDSGSLFLGFTLAVLAIAQQQQASNVFAVIGVPTLIFMIPILDTAMVTITRLMRGQSPARGGRDHASHRLVAFGLSERQALLVLYAVSLSSAVMAAMLESINYWLSLVLAPLLILSLVLLTAYLARLKVVTAAPSPQGKAISRVMLELTYRRRLLEVILDFFLIGIAYYLAFLTRYGLRMDTARLAVYLNSLPIALACAYLAYYFFGVYRSVWRYVDFDDLARFLQASLGAGILLAAIIFGLDSTGWVNWTNAFSHVLLALFGVFLFLGLVLSRSSFKFLDLLATKRVQQDEQLVVIVGASDTGEMALRWISMNPQLKFRPLGFIDADPLMAGRHIHGVEVLGDLTQLPGILESSPAVGVIVTGMDSDALWLAQLAQVCQEHGCWLRRLRLEFEMVDFSQLP